MYLYVITTYFSQKGIELLYFQYPFPIEYESWMIPFPIVYESQYTSPHYFEWCNATCISFVAKHSMFE